VLIEGSAATDRVAVVCREIGPPDVDAVVDLLRRGFSTERSSAFWVRALRRLAEREPPRGLPRFGYALESGDSLVGALLVIASEVPGPDGASLRCNMSSWYVEPRFRPYATLLERRVLRHREATYVNVTPAPHTRPGLLAQGYVPYAGGRAVTLPLLARGGARASVARAAPGLAPGQDLSCAEVSLLLDHARWGCLSLVCTSEGQRYPFVFARRRRSGVIPFAYLLYCRDLDSFVRHARPLGRFLAMRGMPLVVIDTDGPLQGIPGRYRQGYPKYYKGPDLPRPEDLAYTERAVFGV
jgi:hypothetical protein